MALKDLVRRVSRLLGVEVSRYRPGNSDAAKLLKMLSYHQIDCVLDVGANEGQYAKQLRLAGYTGRIVSFEPLSCVHTVLLRRSQGDRSWIVAPRMAIGAEEGTAVINISENLVSSSLCPMTEAHLGAASESRYIEKEETRVARLDHVGREYLETDSRVFLKIDTQGFERQVLDGAQGIMTRITGMQIELSLVPLYEGQTLFEEMLTRLNSSGFELCGLFPCLSDPRTGRLLQVDGILFRN